MRSSRDNGGMEAPDRLGITTPAMGDDAANVNGSREKQATKPTPVRYLRHAHVLPRGCGEGDEKGSN